MTTAIAPERTQEMTPEKPEEKAPQREPQRMSDDDIKEQTRLLGALAPSPYLRRFNPRHYALYEVRHYRPRAYLDSVGIEKIGELVQHGFSLGEICQLIDVSVRVMRVWLTSNGGLKEIEDALKFTSHEDVAQAQRVLYDPIAFPDTPRAKAIADLHLWKAERYNKDMYGTKQVRLEANINNAVSYEFNINVNNKAATPEAAKALEGVFRHIDQALPSPTPTTGAYETMSFEAPDVVDIIDRPSLDFSKD